MTDDFGRRLEAALERWTTHVLQSDYIWVSLLAAVRAANAQVSAPAPTGEWTDGGKCFEEVPEGDGGDLQTALHGLRELTSERMVDGCMTLDQRLGRALLSHIESLERDAAQWRYFRDEMDDGDKLHMLAHGTAHYDSDIDAARKEAK